nr:MAG TPA: hypothetical protein [Caudoviricetes sp.]
MAVAVAYPTACTALRRSLLEWRLLQETRAM